MKVKAYLSHPIRGKNGVNVTAEGMNKNNDKAKFIGNIFRLAFPELDLHIPAEMEEFVGRAYRLQYINESQILDVDCHIIDSCDFVIYYDHQGGFSMGMKKEVNHAKAIGVPGITITSLSDETLFRIESVIKEILKEKNNGKI